MRTSTLAALGSALGNVFAVPRGQDGFGRQTVLSNTVQSYGWTDDNYLDKIIEQGKAVWQDGIGRVETFWEEGRQFIKEQGLIYEAVRHEQLFAHQLRVSNTSSSLCDPDVKQISGYLDTSDDKHLFFWFFESRNSPKDAPLVLWLNGGPGCSSSTGLLFELGPCSINSDGQGTTLNNNSWTEHANMIFLDQPVNVGYSYGDDTVNTTPEAALDVWAFLELFMTKFPQYSKLPFHIAAESYGGRYAPNIASVVHNKNLELGLAPIPGLTHINLASVVLANGLTDPYNQFITVPDFACDGPFPIYDDPEGPECQALRSKAPTCQRLVKACYDWESRLTCLPAGIYCYSQLWGNIQNLGLNPYDVRKKCDKAKDGDLCYKDLQMVDLWLNKPEVKKALGALPSIEFQSCNMEVNQAFFGTGDPMHNSADLLPPLLEAGVRLLVYAGNADFMCNYMGNLQWMLALESHPFVEEFNRMDSVEWVTRAEGKVAGKVRSAGPAGNYTFVEVHDAGHMVPYDQPLAASDLIGRWVRGESLSD